MMAKRLFDLLVAGLALLLLAVPMGLVAIWIRLDSPGPALYRQVRVGRHGRPFRIHKFRTMRHASAGPEITAEGDARITRAGRWLRARRLDELPQLLDVLVGHMSLVGPRPEVPRYLPHYPADLRERVLSVRPGVTDPAALAFRDEGQVLAGAADPERVYIEQLLPAKLRMQADYADRAGLWSDLMVLWGTLAVLRGSARGGKTRSTPGGAVTAIPETTPTAPAEAASFLNLDPFRRMRSLSSLMADGLLVWGAWQATYLFRLGFDRWLSARPGYDAWVALGVVAAYLGVLAAFKVHRSLWRFTGFPEIRRLALACAVAGGLCAVTVSPLLELSKVPRAVLALHPVFSLMALCLARLLWRMFVEHRELRRRGGLEPLRPALVLGAGEAARRLVAGIQGHGWRVLGLLDDDPLKTGATVAGVPVLGPCAEVAEQARRLGATHLILALPSLRGAARRQLIEQVAGLGLPLLTVPSADELREGTQASRVRDIEPDELLGREPVDLDESGVVREVGDQVVMVTGAGGSIGSELCLQLARLRPARLVLVDHSEYALYRIEQRLRERWSSLQLTVKLLDVKDEPALQALVEAARPALVFHAAAYKHVPLVEEGNALAALRNNTLATWRVADVAARCGARRVVLVSTDKAVNPTNVMGATKRAAERLLASLVGEHPGTRFIAVRFGNVLGSSGSVIPRFKEQIAQGGPVTVTHPDIIRYFMTIPEACRLVLQAAAIGQSGQVLVLDMGQPVKIVDLARTMIRLSGHREEDIPIVFTGLRHGEKLYEELLAGEDTSVPTPVPALRLARLHAACSPQEARQWINEAMSLGPTEPDTAVRQHLLRLVPEYRPEGGG